MNNSKLQSKSRLIASDEDKGLTSIGDMAVQSWAKLMPHSLCEVHGAKRLFADENPIIYINCYVAADKSETPHGYLMNDPLHLTFKVEFRQGIYVAEASCKFYTQPAQGSYNAMGSEKLRSGTLKGDPKKVATAIELYMKKAKTMILAVVAEGRALEGDRHGINTPFTWESKL